MVTIAIKNDISRWGWWWSPSAAGGSPSQRHRHNVIVATLWPSVTSQLFSSVSSSPFYLLKIIVCYRLLGVTVTASLSHHYSKVWRRNCFRLYLPLHSIFLKSSAATIYRGVTVTMSLSQHGSSVWRRIAAEFRSFLRWILKCLV